jgi:hypothetical protein
MATVIQPPTASQLAKLCANVQVLINAFTQLFTVQGLFPGLVVYSGTQPVGGFLQVNGQSIGLAANGATVKRADYPALFRALGWVSAATITIASPGVVTWTAHGLAANTPVYFTGGALPTGLVIGTEYFVKTVVSANTFTVSATAGGTVIATSGSQSGIHTATAYPFGVGNGTTTFTLPIVSAATQGVNAYVIF